VGQTPRSKGHICWHPQKGFVIRNTHVKCQSLSTYQSKYIANVKVFNKLVKRQGQRVKSGNKEAPVSHKSEPKVLPTSHHRKLKETLVQAPKLWAGKVFGVVKT
jgi:hypothetical protein